MALCQYFYFIPHYYLPHVKIANYPLQSFQQLILSTGYVYSHMLNDYAHLKSAACMLGKFCLVFNIKH